MRCQRRDEVGQTSFVSRSLRQCVLHVSRAARVKPSVGVSTVAAPKIGLHIDHLHTIITERNSKRSKKTFFFDFCFRRSHPSVPTLVLTFVQAKATTLLHCHGPVNPKSENQPQKRPKHVSSLLFLLRERSKMTGIFLARTAMQCDPNLLVDPKSVCTLLHL